MKILYQAVALFFVLALGGLAFMEPTGPVAPPDKPDRIVSLAPAITATLYELGLEDRIAGVTTWCDYPAEAAAKPKVGGFREVNLEALARAHADLVVLPRDMQHFQQSIENFGIPVLLLGYDSLAAYLEDVAQLGKVCGVEKAAGEFVQRMRTSVRPARGSRASILFVLLNPDEYGAPVGEMTILGADAFFNDILQAAGGENVYQGEISYPRVTMEAALRLNPDLLVLSAPGVADAAQLAHLWRQLLMGDSGKVLVLDGGTDITPGPGALRTLQRIAEALAVDRD